MSYKSEPLVRQVRATREIAGMSQRELGTRSGLTQAHISQIERGATDPGLSNFIDLTRALDLEVVLVPKKLLPAVQSTVRSAPTPSASPRNSPQSKGIARFERQVTKQKQLDGSSTELDTIAESLRLLRYLPLLPAELEILQTQVQRLQEHGASPQSRGILQQIARSVTNLRNAAVHRREEDPRPAYALDEEDEDA
jgi:transcriptional regulator with XRE-family HTH domain